MAALRTFVDHLMEQHESKVGAALPFDKSQWKDATKFVGDDLAKGAMGKALSAAFCSML